MTHKSISKWWGETFTEEKVVCVLLITRLQQSEAYEFSSFPAGTNQMVLQLSIVQTITPIEVP